MAALVSCVTLAGGVWGPWPLIDLLDSLLTGLHTLPLPASAPAPICRGAARTPVWVQPCLSSLYLPSLLRNLIHRRLNPSCMWMASSASSQPLP